MKIRDMSKMKNILVQGRGHFKCTDQCRALPDMNVLTGRMKNSNDCID